jgi:hypothetical protein
MKKLSLISILGIILVSLGCTKELESITKQSNSGNKLKSASGLTDAEMDISTYIQIEDYMPDNNVLVHNERDELINACKENTAYRDRTLSEAMFLFEALVNLDINHLPLPLKKFEKVITVFDIAKTESGTISAASIKAATLTIGAKINQLGTAGRYVGTINVEPIAVNSSSVKVRAVYSTGEPNESPDGAPPVDPNYQKPYGDEDFFLKHYSRNFGGSGCRNPTDPYENAADDLTGYYYNNGTLGIFAKNNPQWSHYVNGQWYLNSIPMGLYVVNPLVPFVTYNPNFFFNTYLSGLYSYVNLHDFHWSFNKTYSEYINNSGLFELIQKSPSPPSNIFITIPELHGYTTTKFIGPTNCTDFNSKYTSNNRIFHRPGIYFKCCKLVAKNCFSECEMTDFIDEYWSHMTDLNVLNSLPLHIENKNIVGFQVLPAYYESFGLRHPEDKNSESTVIVNAEHFIYPAYGQKVEIKKWQE